MKIPYLLGICLLLTACADTSKRSNPENPSNMAEQTFDWQGHRGARGLLPENSVPAFLLALEFPKVTTLELDVAVSKDNRIMVSHEPWLSHHICSWPDGRPVAEEETGQLDIYRMTLDELRQFDCGSRGNERFPGQKPMKVYKPLLSEVVLAADQRAGDLGRPLPRYNIEIKSQPDWDGSKTPDPATFASLLLNEMDRLGIKDRSCVQSFDPRALEAVHQLDPGLITAFLIEDLSSVEDNLEKLSYVPPIYSPYYMVVTANLVEVVHEKGMKIIPWTVNETDIMKSLIDLGVDGIITDYPDRIP